MLTATRRTVASLGACLGLVTLGAAPAAAGGYTGDYSNPVNCAQTSCDVHASTPGSGGGPGPVAPVGGSGASNNTSYTSTSTSTSTETGSSSDAASMGGTGGYLSPPTREEMWASGQWPVYTRPGTNLPNYLVPPPPEAPAAAPPAAAAAPLPTPQVLAQEAVSKLVPTSPTIRTSPTGDQVVHIPTWLWLDASAWRPVSATASVPGLSVTATAEPQSVIWNLGNGDSVTCAGPGNPYVASGDPMAASPSCGYTYHRASAGAPGERFPVTATVTWSVAWVGGGATGTAPSIASTSQASLRVTELQAVVVKG